MEIKGSTKRLIENPGYHIKPKYDLKQLRKRVKGENERDYDVVLPLTSMIDMLSMLTIFLLMNFSATGEAFFINKDIRLPAAHHARPLESLPLITVSPNTVSLDSDVVGSNPTEITMDDDIPQLRLALQKLKGLQKNLETAGIKPKTQINVQADLSTPVLYVKRVMNILISEGFTGINFAVRDLSQE